MERIIQQTELTTVFTREGKIVIPIEEEEKYSIFPKYCVGIRDGYQKNLDKGEVGFFLVKNYCEDESEYKMQMARELGKRDRRYSEKGIEEGWFIGNKEALTDMGELTESIYSYQVEEMKKSPTGYIRDGRNTFYLRTVNNIEVYENVGYRFLLLSQDFKEQNFRRLSSYSIEELEDIVRTQPDNCTLDLHIAMRQLDKARVKRFAEEVVKQQEIKYEKQTREEIEDEL